MDALAGTEAKNEVQPSRACDPGLTDADTSSTVGKHEDGTGSPSVRGKTGFPVTFSRVTTAQMTLRRARANAAANDIPVELRRHSAAEGKVVRMSIRVPLCRVELVTPDGWEATTSPRVLFIHPPGEGRGIGMSDYVVPEAGVFTVSCLDACADSSLERMCGHEWESDTGIASAHCVTTARHTWMLGYEFTDGVGDIAVWLVRPPLAPGHVLKVEYYVMFTGNSERSAKDRVAELVEEFAGSCVEEV